MRIEISDQHRDWTKWDVLKLAPWTLIMESTIYTLHEFMLRAESITYILILAGLIGITLFCWFLTERDED